MIVLDANYILRYLLNDIHEMFLEAKSCIDSEVCLILNEVIAEVIYMMEGLYNIPREVVGDTLVELLLFDNLIVSESKTMLVDALRVYSQSRLDFVDCYLCVLGRKYEIKTFDKQLLKCLAIQE